MAKATLLQREYIPLSDCVLAELVVWQVRTPVRGSRHDYKYRLALVAEDRCVLRYDNEAGKGDHIHEDDTERPYAFTNLEDLRADFWSEVDAWLGRTR